MAQRIITQLIDDISGVEIKSGKGETVSFSLDGRNYEIDLSNKHASQLRSALADYIASARRVGRSTGKSVARVQLGHSPAEVKAWARSNGYTVADRGRVPAPIREAFEAAH